MSTPRLEKHDNGRYYVHWTRDRRSLRVSTGTSSLAEAQKFLGTFLLNDASAATRQTTDALLTIGEAWDLYVSEHADRKTMAAARNVSIGRHLKEAFANLPMAAVKQAHVDRYVRDRAAGRIGKKAAPGTIWLELNKLITACNYAVKKKRALSTERPEIELPDAPEARDRWLRIDEAQRLLTAAAAEREAGERLTRLERFLWIALETAARKRVIETLTWDQIDFESGVIHYRRAGDRVTKKKRPSVPISRALMPVLRRAYAERRGDLVLDTIRPINRETDRIAKAARLSGVTPHVLRHSAATWMARRGVPLWQIAGVLGNTMAMVEKVYAKHCPEGLAEAVEQISAGAFCAQDLGAPHLCAADVADSYQTVAAE